MSTRRPFDVTERREDEWEFNYHSNSVKDFFTHHPFVFCVRNMDAQYDMYDMFEKFADMTNWCKEHCEGNFTTNILKCTETEDDWVRDVLGQERFFIAFDTEKDAFLFNLTWMKKEG